MNKMNVLLEAKPFGLFNNFPREKLEKEGFNVIDMRGGGIDDPDFLHEIKNAEAVLCGNDLRINDELLQKVKNLKIVSKIGAGCDNIDIPSATKHNIMVCDTPGMNKQAVADHAFALLLSVARKIVYGDASTRQGEWEHTKILGLDVWGKTMGIIGLGSIGQCVAQRAKGFQMNVLGYDPYWPTTFAEDNEIEKVDIPTLCEKSDFISIHIPLLPETRGLINLDLLKRMKHTTILINTSRGGIINETDLCEVLENSAIGGAGLDVFENEPPKDSPLLSMDNVVLSPHTSAFTFNSLYLMDITAVNQIISFFKGTMPEFALNQTVFQNNLNNNSY